MRLIFLAIASGHLPIHLGETLKIAKPILIEEEKNFDKTTNTDNDDDKHKTSDSHTAIENNQPLTNNNHTTACSNTTASSVPVTLCRLQKISQSNSIEQLCTVELEPTNPPGTPYLIEHQG